MGWGPWHNGLLVASVRWVFFLTHNWTHKHQSTQVMSANMNSHKSSTQCNSAQNKGAGQKGHPATLSPLPPGTQSSLLAPLSWSPLAVSACFTAGGSTSEDATLVV